MGGQGWIGPAIIAAFIGAAVSVGGWFVNSQRERARESRLRRERMRDVQSALAAEILPYMDALELFDLTDHLSRTVDRMRADEGFVPLVPTERNDTVFRAILPDIHILPEPVIRPVVRYYSQLFAIEAIIGDLRSEAFRALSAERREAIYADYISMKIQALKLGRAAVESIEASLGPADG